MNQPTPIRDDTGWIDRREAQGQAANGIGLFAFLRKLEREAGTRPRIGRNARLRDALVRMGQDPALAFPGRDIARVDKTGNIPRLRAQFMGFFGAFGAFPLNWTEETNRWFDSGDEAFVAFVDIFAERFQELFFRAWSDAHAITQFDHPTNDRFQAWLLSLIGQGTPAFAEPDSLPATFRLRFLALSLGEVKSPVRLRQMLAVHFGPDVTIEIEEFVPMWLDFEPESLSRLGQGCATLGHDCHLGARVLSISDKITLHVHVQTAAQFDTLLPGGDEHRVLTELVFGYLGQRTEIDVNLWLPQGQVRPAVLSEAGRLGWMACIRPASDKPADQMQVTRYRLNQTLPQVNSSAAPPHESRFARAAST
ncbi:MAG: type VI secretion system baseplate subunit TssG [Loktanella sp.]|nr:type VI secretion system baseplate subunit TssG [Loktanella sp.]